MRFLLVNTNNAVRKIFNITAKKAAIQLDVISAISQIPLKEDYNCIFIDDGVLGSGDVSNFRNKMMMTKFCIILSKDSPMIGGFDSYIRKPFLPTDIYEVMKKEKNSDLNTAPKSAQTPVINANSDIDLNEFSDSEDEFLSGPKETIDFEMTPDLSINGAKNAESEIDLGLDSALDSAKNEKSGEIAESNQIADDFEINFTLDSAELSKEDDSKNSTNAEMLDIKATQEVDLADSKSADIPLDSAPKSAPKSVDIMEEAEAQINNIKALADKGGNFYNSSNDSHSIDFSAVMALQDELLKEEESKKKKRLIGGDISKKKEPKARNSADSATHAPKNTDSANFAESPTKNADSAPLAETNDLNEGEADFLSTLNALNSADSAKLNDDLNFDALDDLQGISDIKSDEIPAPSAPKSADEILNNLDINNIEVAESGSMQDFENTFAQSINAEIDSISPNFNAKDFSDETSQDAQKYNMLGLPINESGEIKDINDLSESELEKLDDEALLLLQERALQEKSKTPAQKSPKILNKAQIDTINNILETTQGAGENSAGEFGNDFGGNEFAIKNNEFDSITQEALSEALSEQDTQQFESGFGSNDFMHDSQNLGNFGDDFADSAINNFAQDVEPEESELPKFENFEQENEFALQDFAQDMEPEEFELPDNFEASNLTQNPQNINEDFAFDLPAQPQPTPAPQPAPQVMQQQIPQTPPSAPQIQNAQIKVGENLDLAEIIKTFPVDKLRDLLSGVQITINITFPTKKQ